MTGRFRRLGLDTLLALAACGVLLAAGSGVAFGVLPAAAGALTQGAELIFPDPVAMLRAQLGLVAVLSMPPVLAWGTLFVWRLRHQAPPSGVRMAVCLAAVLGATLLGVATQLWLVHEASSAEGPRPLMAVGALFPAWSGLRLATLSAAALSVVNALRRE